MPTDATATAAKPASPRGTAGSFRLLTARLRRPPPPLTQPVAAGPAPSRSPAPVPAPEAPPHGPGEAAAALLDIIWGAVGLPPHERSMAGDTLLLLLPDLPVRELASLAERIAAMDRPPPLIVSRLLLDPRPEVGGVVLERTAQLDTADLLAACAEADRERLLLLARRRHVPPAVTEQLVRAGDLPCHMALLRNPGAEMSFHAFRRLSQLAGEHPGLQAPLALRADLPLAVALDLFWRLPPELRRVVIARFLSDSVTLSRILSIALVTAGIAAEGAAVPAAVEDGLAPLLAGQPAEAARRLARLTGVNTATVERIFSDQEGEALVVLLKALGLGRARADEALDRVRAATGLLRSERPPEELKAVFDALSFTNARVLLTYWDWNVQKLGPYAPADGLALVEAAPVA